MVAAALHSFLVLRRMANAFGTRLISPGCDLNGDDEEAALGTHLHACFLLSKSRGTTLTQVVLRVEPFPV